MSSTLKTAISDLCHLGWLKIAGPEAKKFLQGQLTCNMDDISDAQSRLGAHCNPKGRIISLFRIFYYKESYYLQMPRDLIPFALNALKKYAVFFKVTLSDASNEFISIGYIGNSLHSFPLPLNPLDVTFFNNLLIFKTPDPLPRYELLGDKEAITEFKKLTPNAENLSIDDWKYQDIKAMIPHVYPETSEKFLPHELNLHLNNGISFNKGCYTGQEIIARMHYRGQLKTQLHSITIQSDVEPKRGQDVAGTRDMIVDYCKKDEDTYILLVLTK
jgi:folate-binding protein YgfZ